MSVRARRGRVRRWESEPRDGVSGNARPPALRATQRGNHDRPHQSLATATPASRLRPASVEPATRQAALDLVSLTGAVPSPSPTPCHPHRLAPLRPDVTAVGMGSGAAAHRPAVPAGSEQLKFSTVLAGRTVTVWADDRSIHACSTGTIHTRPASPHPACATCLPVVADPPGRTRPNRAAAAHPTERRSRTRPDPRRRRRRRASAANESCSTPPPEGQRVRLRLDGQLIVGVQVHVQSRVRLDVQSLAVPGGRQSPGALDAEPTPRSSTSGRHRPSSRHARVPVPSSARGVVRRHSCTSSPTAYW
jgi:hypothetical protein